MIDYRYSKETKNNNPLLKSNECDRLYMKKIFLSVVGHNIGCEVKPVLISVKTIVTTKNKTKSR